MLVLVLGLTACVGQGMSPSVTLVPTATGPGSLPIFSDPTNVTNPYFPVSLSGQAISLGTG
ncbi:MAG: hypothetical protein Kow0063_20730 [Anaerolineae bacterium]